MRSGARLNPGRGGASLASSTVAWRDRLLLGVMVLVALGLRLARLGFQPLWWDEGWSLYFATSDLGSMLGLTAVDIHPPLYYLVLHLWIGILGSSVLSVRLLSVLIGTITVPVLYVTGQRLFGRRAGLVAAGLLAVSPFHIFYSQEVRMYGLVTLLGLAALYFAVRWTQDSIGPSNASPVVPTSLRGTTWILGPGYIVAAALALYTAYYAAFLLLALNFSVLIVWLRRRRREPGGAPWIVSWLGAQVAVVLIFVPWLWYAAGKLTTYVRYKIEVEQDPALDLIPYVGRHLAAFDWGHAEGLLAGWWWLGLVPLGVLLFCGGALLVLARQPGQQDDGVGYRLSGIGGWILQVGHWPLAIITIVFLCGFGVNLGFPFNPPRSERLLLLALPAYLLLVAAALLALWKVRRSLGILAAASFLLFGLLSLSFFYAAERYAQDDYRPVAARIQALGLPKDAVIAVHPWQVGYLQAYIPDDVRPTLFLTPREVLPRERQLWADAPARMATELDGLLAEHSRLWLLDHRAMGRVLESHIEAYLGEKAYPTLSEWYGENTVLSLFAAGETGGEPVAAQFGSWLSLEGARLSVNPLEAGWGVVTIDLGWELLDEAPGSHQVGLRLVDDAGRLWAQRDSLPKGGLEEFSDWTVGEPELDRQGLLVPAGTPPGEYKVTLRVYERDGVTVVPVVFERGSGGEVTIGSVQVIRPERYPPETALELDQPLEVDFRDQLRLVGYSLGDATVFQPGDAVEVELFWQALRAPGEDFLPRLELLDSQGQAVAELTEKPVGGDYPTAWWQAGELVRDPHALLIPAPVPAGQYRLAMSLVRAADEMVVEPAGRSGPLDLGQIEVEGRAHRYEPTTPSQAQSAEFGSSVQLVGYDLADEAHRPGSVLEVTMHWHALETPDRNYHTFAHLLDAGGNIVAQDDGPPAEGKRPALGWLPGEYVTDTRRIALPADLPDGVYRLGVGLYEPATGLRLGERELLDTPVTVEGSYSWIPPSVILRASRMRLASSSVR